MRLGTFRPPLYAIYQTDVGRMPVARADSSAELLARAAPGRARVCYAAATVGQLGQVEAIHIAPRASAPMQPMNVIDAVAGAGLAGDRYLARVGFYSDRPTDPGAREVTLIEAEVLDWLGAEHQIAFSSAEHRRNLTTRGVRLAALLGHRFRIGDVLLEGVRDCPPCEHLVELTSKPVLVPLVTRGGLRARILESGTIRVGDPIALEVAEAAGVP